MVLTKTFPFNIVFSAQNVSEVLLVLNSNPYYNILLHDMNMFPAHTQFLLYFLLTKYGNKFMHGSPVNKPNKN